MIDLAKAAASSKELYQVLLFVLLYSPVTWIIEPWHINDCILQTQISFAVGDFRLLKDAEKYDLVVANFVLQFADSEDDLENMCPFFYYKDVILEITVKL